MTITSFYPVLMTRDVSAETEFWSVHVGLRPVFSSDWYVHLQHPHHEEVNLAVVDGGHETVPAEGRGQVAGLLLNIEVDDVDAVHKKMTAADLPILLALRDEPFGQRHFITRSPAGVLVDVITVIPPTPEFAAGYEESALPVADGTAALGREL